MARKKAPVEKKPSFNLFEYLQIADSGTRFNLEDLSEDERKGFSPYIIMRWMAQLDGSGTEAENRLINCNEQVNRYVFALGKHPNLLNQLFINLGTGRVHRHKYLGLNGKKSKGNTVLEQLYPDMKMDDIKHMMSVMTPSQLEQLIRDHGLED